MGLVSSLGSKKVKIDGKKLHIWGVYGTLLDYTNNSETVTTVRNDDYLVMPGGVVSGGPRVSSYTHKSSTLWMKDEYNGDEVKVVLPYHFDGRAGHKLVRVSASQDVSNPKGYMYALVNLTSGESFYINMDKAKKELFPKKPLMKWLTLAYWVNYALLTYIGLSSFADFVSPPPYHQVPNHFYTGFISDFSFIVAVLSFFHFYHMKDDLNSTIDLFKTKLNLCAKEIGINIRNAQREEAAASAAGAKST